MYRENPINRAIRERNAEQSKWEQFYEICADLRDFFSKPMWDKFIDECPDEVNAALEYVKAERENIMLNF